MARRIDNKPRPHICKLVENTCKKTFILKRDITRHQRRHFPTKMFIVKNVLIQVQGLMLLIFTVNVDMGEFQTVE